MKRFVTLLSASLIALSISSCNIGSLSNKEIEVFISTLPLNNTISVGENFKLEASCLNTDNQNIIWESKNTNIVTISSDGVIEGIKAGTGLIYAISEEDDTKSVGLNITVKEVDPYENISVTITNKVDSLFIGENRQIVANVKNDIDNAGVTYSSSNTSVATIDENGIIKAKKVGSTTIRATSASNNKKYDEFILNVSENTSKELVVNIDESTVISTLGVGESHELTATVTNYNSDSSVWWKSSDSTIISVSTKGIIKGIKEGIATISAYSNENRSKFASLTITCTSAIHGYQLVWEDDFNGSSLNENYWNYQIGNGELYGNPGWGNSEQQYYRKENVSLRDGNLVITAKREDYNGYKYTSARIRTNGKVAKTYGRVEAKIKLPKGQGLWPAFWLLPDSSTYGSWPNSGEIDIMEAKGRLLYESSGALHYATESGAHKYDTATNYFPDNEQITDYHIYAVERDENEFRWYVDDNNFLTVSVWSITGKSSSNTAPFDTNFHILFNMACGGHFDGYRNPLDSDLPAEMLVDYVRWYQK